MQQEQAVAPETPAAASNTADGMQTQNPQHDEASSEKHQPPQSPLALLPATPPAPKATAPCGVCGADGPKYKCPRCYMPYCSVACNKTHKENHPPDEPRPPVTNPDELVTSKSNDPSKSQTCDPSNPFSALDTSDKLQHLFRKYPKLPEQLRIIYAATQPPEEAPDKRLPASMMQGVSRKENWNHDIGIKNGKEALRKARKAKGQAGDAIREYSELVLHLINTHDEKGQAAIVLQQKMAQEDSKLIEQLMAQERG
ncbi:hypothetical protein E4U21_007334 [Claviceps maximensis]|nr:hypothetical protein E4U21_007334 [Claviceps maximensis]